ncbi:hypothetical protein LIER_27030 [Lithospermum erythrorhizon]|uniref:PGG domain-containing protein n=1 Tax=Lithospermum erythrorhizon TaxID=34254 RepID=A0AAV3RDY2_LITER
METLAGFDIYMDLGLSGDMRNALLVVAVLIATATYQSMLQQPGGYMQIDSTDGSINRTVFKLAMPENPFTCSVTFDVPYILQLWPLLIKLQRTGWCNGNKYRIPGEICSRLHIWRSVLKTFLSKNGAVKV